MISWRFWWQKTAWNVIRIAFFLFISFCFLHWSYFSVDFVRSLFKSHLKQRRASTFFNSTAYIQTSEASVSISQSQGDFRIQTNHKKDLSFPLHFCRETAVWQWLVSRSMFRDNINFFLCCCGRQHLSNLFLKNAITFESVISHQPFLSLISTNLWSQNRK